MTKPKKKVQENERNSNRRLTFGIVEIRAQALFQMA